MYFLFFIRLVGGLYGRIIGRLMTTMFGVHSEDYGYWAWMDPGVFSLIGAALFFGGVTRLNLAVTVIMVRNYLCTDTEFMSLRPEEVAGTQ